jgi:hypothetical protein
MDRMTTGLVYTFLYDHYHLSSRSLSLMYIYIVASNFLADTSKNAS